MTAEEFNNSPRLIVARLLRDVWRAAILLVLLERWGNGLPGPWPTVLRVLVLIIIAAFVLEPVAAVFFTRLRVDQDRLGLRVGLIAPTERTSALTAVSSVQVDEPWYLRALGLRSVTIAAQGVESSAFVMAGLRTADALRLASLVGVAESSAGAEAEADDPTPGGSDRSRPTEPHPTDGEPPSSDGPTARRTVTYAPTRWDLAATIASQGTLVLAAVAVVGVAEEVGDLLGVDVVAAGSTQRPWVLALLVLGLLLVSGVAAALRFRGFVIERSAAGSYRVSYGAVERTSHTISRDQVVAVAMVTTPLDALMGTSRVVLSAARLRESPMGDVRFPSIRRARAVQLVRELTGARLPELDRAVSRWSGLVPVLALLGTAGLVAVLPRSALWVTAVEAVVALVVVVLLLQYLTGRVQVAADDSYVVWSRVGLSRTTSVYSAGCARVVVVRRAAGLPVGNLTMVGFAHRREVRRKPVRSADVLTALRRVQQSATARPWAPTAEGAR